MNVEVVTSKTIIYPQKKKKKSNVVLVYILIDPDEFDLYLVFWVKI